MNYPCEVKIGLGIVNFFQKFRNDPFRVFIHPIQKMESLLIDHGFARTKTKSLFVWEMSLYEKV